MHVLVLKLDSPNSSYAPLNFKPVFTIQSMQRALCSIHATLLTLRKLQHYIIVNQALLCYCHCFFTVVA